MVLGCTPAPNAYDVKTSEAVKGPVSFQKSPRFKKETGKWSNGSPILKVLQWW